jgi:hypothetical protein
MVVHSIVFVIFCGGFPKDGGGVGEYVGALDIIIVIFVLTVKLLRFNQSTHKENSRVKEKI